MKFSIYLNKRDFVICISVVATVSSCFVIVCSSSLIISVPREGCASQVSNLYKSLAGRYRPVRVADGPITARYKFIKNVTEL